MASPFTRATMGFSRAAMVSLQRTSPVKVRHARDVSLRNLFPLSLSYISVRGDHEQAFFGPGQHHNPNGVIAPELTENLRQAPVRF